LRFALRVLLALALWGLLTRHGAFGYVVTGLLVLWAIGGLSANIRAIRNGFKTDD
jgi:hypothetical protein